MMEFGRNVSIFWSLSFTLVLFLMLFTPRYSQKKTMGITLATMAPLILANFILAMRIPPDTYGVLLLLTASLPSMIVFWLLSKKRDGRFFFTFCMVDTIVLEIMYITQIINYYISPYTNIFMFTSRLVVFPVMSFLVYRFLRPTYRELQRVNRHGWTKFAIIGILFYVTITLAMNRPTHITQRPAYYPVLILLFILMPVIYWDILATLKQQLTLFESNQREDILKLQTNNVVARVEELAQANDRFREERHNYRHKMKTIASLVKTHQYEELESLMEEYLETIQKTRVVRYCDNAVIDAVLSTYINHAEAAGIRVNPGFDFPAPIPVDATELATVFANAIENAIHACEKLPPEKRFIEIKVLSKPRFMVMIKNSFDGNAEFDEKDIPVNREEGHGFGTRSIVAFCEKHKAFYRFVSEGREFTLYLNF